MRIALDIGCGDALDLERVPEFNWIGLDKHDFAHLYPSGRFRQHDLKDPLPYPDSSIGMIWCHHVLEHLPQRHPTRDIDYVIWVINEFHRVLRAGAQCHLIVPWKEHKNDEYDPTHYRHFSTYTFNWFTDKNLDAVRESSGLCGAWRNMQSEIRDGCHVYAILIPLKT